MTLADEKRFRICREAGRGKRAVVYEAVDTLLHRPVALKVAHDRSAHQDLVEEGQRLARVRSPFIVTLYDADPHTAPGLVLEWLSGMTLRQVMQSRSPLPFEIVSRWTQQLLLALDAAHRVNVLHGDVKPENIWIDTDDQLKLFDFGMTPRRGGDATTLYAAPEVLDGREHSAQSDIYCAGGVIFEMLSTQLPFDGTDVTDLRRRKTRQRAPRIDESGGTVPEEIEAWVARALQRNSTDRFDTALRAYSAWTEATSGMQLERQRNEHPTAVHPEVLHWLFDSLPEGGGFAGNVLTLTGASGLGKSWLLHRLSSLHRDSPRLIELHGDPEHHEALETWSTGWGVAVQGPPGDDLSAVMHQFETRSGNQEPHREILVLVDDFERCDPATRQLLVLLARQASRLRLGMLVTCNDRHLQDAMGEWCALQDASSSCAALDAPTPSRLRGLLRPTADNSMVPEALLEYVHALCAGNPRHTRLLLADLEASGALRHQKEAWSFEVPVEDVVPRSSIPHLEALLASLDPAQRQALREASLHGERFDIADLAQRLGRDASKLSQQLHDVAHRTEFLHYEDNSLRFTMPLLQMHLESSIAPMHRRQAHQAICDRLLASPNTEDSALGRHLFHAGRLSDARAHLQSAGEDALNRHQLESARRLLHLALRCIENEPNSEDEAATFADLMLLQATTLLELASWEVASQLIDRCLLLSRAWGLSKQEVRAIRTRGRIHYKQGRFEDAVATLGEAQSIATEAQDPDEAHELTLQVSNIHFECGRLEAALEGYMTALLFGTERGNADLEARASNNVALVYSTMGNKPEAIRMFHRSLQLFQKLGRQDAVARIQHNIGMTYLDLRNWREARNHFRESIRIASQVGLDEMVAVSRLEHAETNLRLGRIEEARPDIEKALILCQKRHDPLGTATAYRLQGMTASLEGDVRRAEEHLERSIALLRGLGETPHLALALQERGRLRLEAGDPVGARPVLDEARRIFESLETPHDGLEDINLLWERCLNESG